MRELDHTADIGFEVSAASLPELFHRSALGMMALLYGAESGISGAGGEAAEPAERGGAAGWGPSTNRRIELSAADPTGLLALWLRELLYLHEVHGLVYRSVDFSELDGEHLRAEIHGRPCGSDPIRELKGVTYHALDTVRDDGRWRARVILDV